MAFLATLLMVLTAPDCFFAFRTLTGMRAVGLGKDLHELRLVCYFPAPAIYFRAVFALYVVFRT